MTDLDAYMKQYQDAIENAGGYIRTKGRLLEARVFLALSMRAQKDVESVSFDANGILGDNSFRIDFCTKTGIVILRIPAYSCFELKINPNADSNYWT